MSNSTGSVEKLDDTDPRIVYTNGTIPWDSRRAWHIFGVYQDTLHATRDTECYATVTFKGVSISVSSLFLPQGGNFIATLDGRVYGPFNITIPGGQPQVVKEAFRQDGLDATPQHTLVLRKSGDPLTTYFNIDFISVQGTVLSPPGVSTVPTASISITPTAEVSVAPTTMSTTSAEIGNRENRVSLSVIIGVAILGLVLLVVAAIGANFFIHRRRHKTALNPRVEAYHVDTAESPLKSKSRAIAIKVMRELGVTTDPTPSKGAPRLPAKPVVLPTTKRDVSITRLFSSKPPPLFTPTPATEATHAPLAPPTPRTPSPDAKFLPTSASDLSAIPHC